MHIFTVGCFAAILVRLVAPHLFQRKRPTTRQEQEAEQGREKVFPIQVTQQGFCAHSRAARCQIEYGAIQDIRPCRDP